MYYQKQIKKKNKEEYIMMKVNQFVDTLTKIEKEPTKYLSGGWGHYKDEKWCFDCICLIKSVLWGFNFDKNKPRGGICFKWCRRHW